MYGRALFLLNKLFAGEHSIELVLGGCLYFNTNKDTYVWVTLNNI